MKNLVGVNILAGLILGSWAFPCVDAQCYLPEPIQADATHFQNLKASFGTLTTLGLIYFDQRCFPEAEEAFTKAKNAADTSDLKEKADSYIALAKGRIAWHNGDFDIAKATLLPLARFTQPTNVGYRAALSLAELLLIVPDRESWVRLRIELLDLSERGFWRADRDLALLSTKMDSAETSIIELEAALAGDLPTLSRLTKQVVLLDTLKRAGRTLEAKLLSNSIEQEVGEKVIDGSLRMFYLQTCAALWQPFALKGDPEAQFHYNAYVSAISSILSNP